MKGGVIMANLKRLLQDFENTNGYWVLDDGAEYWDIHTFYMDYPDNPDLRKKATAVECDDGSYAIMFYRTTGIDKGYQVPSGMVLVEIGDIIDDVTAYYRI
jgi:hypothetical protein